MSEIIAFLGVVLSSMPPVLNVGDEFFLRFRMKSSTLLMSSIEVIVALTASGLVRIIYFPYFHYSINSIVCQYRSKLH